MAEEDLRDFVTFTGTLSRQGVAIPIRFRVRFGTDGELRFRVYPIPMTRATGELLSLRHEGRSEAVPLFTVDGTSASGTTFHSDSIIISNSGSRTTQTTAHEILGFRYSKATFHRPLGGETHHPAMRWRLRGFECFPELQITSPLGEIRMQGTYPSPSIDKVSGYFYVSPEEEIADIPAWRSSVERIFETLRELMGFAICRHIKAPSQELWTKDYWECIAYSQTRTRRTNQHVFHPMMLQGFFEAATASFFEPKIPVRNLGHTLEWFAMEATYNEMRLMHPMTSIESLVDANLEEAKKFFLPTNAFKRTRRAMRQAADEKLKEDFIEPGSVTRQAAAEFLSALPGKMQDVNRRPLQEKMLSLAEEWKVPLSDLPMDRLSRAISARNAIVHRGYYYDPEPETPQARDLWDHILLMREIVVRFVLTVIGFRGKYLSFRGGQHDVEFPPELSPQSISD